MVKRDELEKTAKDIYDHVLSNRMGIPSTPWEESPDSAKAFYRKIARWHLELYPIKRMDNRKGGKKMKKQKGSAAVEYALIVALIAGVAVAGVALFGDWLKAMFDSISSIGALPK